MKVANIVVVLVLVILLAARVFWRAGADAESVPTSGPPAASTAAGASVNDASARLPSAGQAAAPSAPSVGSSMAVTEPIFEVSASVHEFCGESPWEACRQVEAFLDAMATESREPEWAALMEESISTELSAALQGHAQIRAVQCRRTRCAVEYATPAELGNLEPGGDLTFGGALVQNAGVFVPEMNAATGNVIVTVLTWRADGVSDIE